MELVRGKAFRRQARLNLLSFWIFCLGFFRLLTESKFYDSQGFYFCLFLMGIFVARLIIGIINFKNEERKVLNRGIPENMQYFKRGATLDDIENLALVKLNKENIEKFKNLCGLCTENFEEDQWARLLPCSEFHSFHKDCIDR